VTMPAAWRRFWFQPQPTSTLALTRIAFGIVVLVWGVSLRPDLYAFFTDQGIPVAPSGRTALTLLSWSQSPAMVTAVWLVLIVVALSYTIGLHTRIAGVLTFLCLLSLQRANPEILNSGDVLLRLIAFFMMFAPAGVALSVDRLRRGAEPFWTFPARAPWALRLVQIQLSVLYVSTVWWKFQGETWNDGTALWYVWHLDQLSRFTMPGILTESLILVNVLTFGTLAMELAVGVLVWVRAARAWVLLAGVILHLAIEFTMNVGLFSWVVFVGYLAFVSPDASTRFILALRSRLAAHLQRAPSTHPADRPTARFRR
jgi:hypothetical protein